MKSVFMFLLILVAVAFQSISVQALPTAADQAEAVPTLQQQDPKSAQELEKSKCDTAKAELRQCASAAKEIPQACKNVTDADVGKIIGQNQSAGQQAGVGAQVAKISQDTANRCNAAYDKCNSKCEKAMQTAESACVKEDEKQKAKDAAKGAKNYCEKEGKSRADKAQQQADANKAQEKDGKENGEKNAGGGGGAPQMPQMPPKEEKPKEEAKKDQKENCTAANAGSEACPVTVACTQPGGALNSACQMSPITGPVLKSADFDGDRFPASEDITAP